MFEKQDPIVPKPRPQGLYLRDVKSPSKKAVYLIRPNVFLAFLAHFNIHRLLERQGSLTALTLHVPM